LSSLIVVGAPRGTDFAVTGCGKENEDSSSRSVSKSDIKDN
jgi:hypothetical protein